MNIEQDIVDYVRGVNPTLVDRVDSPGTLKLRRVLDSLDMVEFLAFLEKRFSIKVRDEDVLSRNFETVDSVIEFVRSRRDGDGSGG